MLNNRVAEAPTGRAWWAVPTLTALTALLLACAGKGDINRTQPDKVDKAIFFDASGNPRTFYYRKATVAVPPTSAYAFEGSMGQTMKVRFDIREKYLVGYRSYDYSPGSEGEFGTGKNNQDAPMLVFAITSHFDVKREYNPATGEQTNVISENTNDRPWNERSSMRVDWSHNLAEAGADRDAADPMATFLPAQTLETGFTVGEGDQALVNPNRPIITASYIDFATKELRTPDFNACLAMFDPFDDSGPFGCGPAEITYRNSLLPVAPSEYEPLPYPDRQVLNDDAGKPIRTVQDQVPCDPAILAMTGGGISGADCSVAAVDQFSKFGFFRSVRPTYDRKVGVTEAGREYLIDRWNIWQETIAKDGNGKPILDASGVGVRIPLGARKTRVITYYLNAEFPDDPALREAASQVIGDWNEAMKETVAALQATAKNATPSVPSLVERAKALPDIMVLSPNGCSVDAVNAFVAAHADTKKKLTEQVGAGALDLDHITKGNLLSACSALSAVTEDLPDGDAKKFVWQRDGDLRYSFLAWVDRPQVSGPLGYGPIAQDPETGEIISASAFMYGANLDTYTQFAADSVQLMNGAISPDDLLSGKTISDVLQESARASKLRQSQTISDAARAHALSKMQARGTTPAQRLTKVGAGIDDQVLTRLKGSSLSPLLFNDDVLPGLFPQHRPGDLDPGDPVDVALTKPWMSSQASEKRRKRAQTLGQNGCVYLAEFADDAILATALALDQQKLTGDALWKALRVAIFRGLADHEVGHTMGLRHNFAASFDALNYDDRYWQVRTTVPEAEWEANGLSEMEYSSVMDYGSRFNSDVRGLGRYDMAAIRFGYGQLVDIMPFTPNQFVKDVGGLQNAIFLGDYKQIPTMVGGLDMMNAAATLVMPYSTVVGALRDGYRNLATNGGSFNIFPERPYKFCSDEFEGNLDCKRWDKGANQQEIVDNAIDLYRNYYVFNAYKRGRTTWNIDSYLNKIRDRYFNRFQQAFQFFYFFGQQLAGRPLADDLFLASTDSLNALGSILQTPEPGAHCVTANSPNVMVLPSRTGPNACAANQQPLGIGLPDAKPYYIDFSDDYYYRITRTGSLYEKLEALFALTNTEAQFFRVDSFADASRYSINFYQLFRDEIVNLLSGVIRDDPSAYGGTLTAAGYQPTPVLDLTQWGLVNPPVPDYAKPGVARVDTPVNRTIQHWAMTLSLARLGSSWDSTLDFQNYLAVTVKGSDDDLTLATGTVVKEFTHPTTGVTYRAPAVGGSGGPGNIGAGLIDELNAIVGQAGTPGTLPTKYGSTSTGAHLPDWQTAKAALDAAKAAGDQVAFQSAQALFDGIDGLVGFRADLLADIRNVRKQLLLP